MKIKPSKNFDGSNLAGGMVDALAIWTVYLDALDWGPGNRDATSWSAFLRAGSLGVEPNAAAQEVTSRITAGGGTFTGSKIQSQLRRAYAHAAATTGESKALVKPPKPIFDPAKLKKVALAAPGIDEAWLADQSPVPPATITSTQFLDALYRPGEKIVLFSVFESQGQCIYEAGAKSNGAIPTGTAGVWFLANPVDGKYYPNPRQENKPSCRSEEAVTSWRYLVLENDVADRAEWLAALVQFPLKIVAIYTSGGKSIHALVRLDAPTKADWDAERDKVKHVLVTLGADPGALTAVRLTRLPGTMRGDKPQKLLFLNPNPDGNPIFKK